MRSGPSWSNNEQSEAMLSSPVGIGIVGCVVVDCLPRRLSEMILKSFARESSVCAACAMVQINAVMATVAGSRLTRSSSLFLASAAGGHRFRPVIPTEPERDAKTDQQCGAEQEEDDGLLQPGYRRDRESHRKAEEGNL